MENSHILGSYGICAGSTIHQVLRLTGGGGLIPTQEMSIVAEGNILQSVRIDAETCKWLPVRTTVFNVQILNSTTHQTVSGEKIPEKPIDVQTYDKYGFPFFAMYAEPSGVYGDFNGVKSVRQIEGTTDEHIIPHTVAIGRRGIGSLEAHLHNLNGSLRVFRTADDLKQELDEYHVASF